MKYKLLGNSGIRVSELNLGTMTFGEDWGFGAGKEECKKVYDAFTNAGGNFVDTANLYTKNTSETFLGDFIKSERSNIVVASKYSLTESSKINQAGNHRKNMVESIDKSLKRLQSDYIDLYYVHAWDFTVGEQELMKTLEYLVSSGKVLTIGISDTPAWVTAKCNTIAELRGWSSFAAYQVEYGLHDRSVERDILPMVEASGMVLTAFSPLGAGLLTGKYNLPATNEPRRMKLGSSVRLSERNLELTKEVVNLAAECDMSPAQLALSWVRAQSPNIITLFGARNENQCLDNIGSLQKTIPEDIMKKLNEISAIKLGFPHDFLASKRVEEILYGDHKDAIEWRN